MCIQNLVSFCQFVLRILSKNKILMPMKDHKSITMIYNTNVDLVNDDLCTKFGLILSICSQDIQITQNKFWPESRAVMLLHICQK